MLRQTIENAANPLKLKNGGPGGIATEWVELHPSRKRLYAVTSFWNTAEAQIVTYNVDPARPEASLEKLGEAVSTKGHQGCHVAMHPTGNFLAVSHYISGSVALFRCGDHTALQPPVETVTLRGERRPLKEFSHTGPLAHGAAFAPDGALLAVCDAGQGRVALYAMDAETGRLTLASEVPCGSARVSSGWLQCLVAGSFGHRPRHIAFHPRRPLAFVVHECSNAISWHGYSQGELTPPLGQLSSQHPVEAAACMVGLSLNAASELTVSPDGKFLYASNRGFACCSPDDSVTCFSIDQETGELEFIDAIDTAGTPRHFALLADKGLMVIGMQKGQRMGVAEVDRDGGMRLTGTHPVEGHEVTCAAVL